MQKLRQGTGRYAFALVVLATAAGVRADLNPGDNFQNPDLVALPPNYTDGLPGWYGGSQAASLISAIAPPTLGTPFVGNVRSEVWFVNGVDASGGLGFVYQFTLDPSYSADGLESASFSPAQWGLFTISDTGSDNSGTSSAVAPPAIPPAGFTNWSDGDPYTIRRDAGTGAPEIRWTGTAGGTTIEGGQSSALIWFETNATMWTNGIVTLLDGGVGGSAIILTPAIPEPAGATLGLLGLGLMTQIRRRRVV